MSKKCHPDIYPDDDQKEAVFKQLNDAYQVLSDKNKRKEYDESLVGRSYSGTGNPIRSAKDYANYKRESENLYNNYSNKQKKRDNFNNPNSNKNKNKYGFANEQNFGKGSADAPKDHGEQQFYKNHNSYRHQQNYQQTYEPVDNGGGKAAIGFIFGSMILILLNIIGSNNRKTQVFLEQEKIRKYDSENQIKSNNSTSTEQDRFREKNRARNARQLSPLFNADKSYDPVNIGYLTKASAYKEKVRMEKLRKQMQAEETKKS